MITCCACASSSCAWRGLTVQCKSHINEHASRMSMIFQYMTIQSIAGAVKTTALHSTDPKKRIVITGIGVASCFGNDPDKFYEEYVVIVVMCGDMLWRGHAYTWPHNQILD